MSIFPMLRPGAPPHQSLAERLREAERQRAAVEQELARVISESEADAHNAASAIARLSADLDRQRARADEFEQIMTAMGREFGIMNVTATELAKRAGIAPGELTELKSMLTKVSADPDHAAVGLHQSAPAFLVRAARTAFRKACHPDTKPAPEKAAAEAAFKRHEAAFERLFRTRGLG